jgi:hypothetical protein
VWRSSGGGEEVGRGKAPSAGWMSDVEELRDRQGGARSQEWRYRFGLFLVRMDLWEIFLEARVDGDCARLLGSPTNSSACDCTSAFTLDDM